MPAGYYDILCEQGATFQRVFTWKDKVGELVPLAGYTARMQVRRFVTDTAPVISLTTENGRISLPSAGKIHVTLDAATTAGLQKMDAVYDLELISSAGVVTRLLRGKFIVDPEVTR